MSMFSSASIRIIGLLTICTAIACTGSYSPATVQYDKVRITTESPKDKNLEQLLKPYSDSVNHSMNIVVGELERELEKKLPEGTLNNLLADAMQVEASKAFGVPVDAAFVNYGGVRTSQLPAGPITIGKVYEIMPFDNLLIIQELKGSVLQQLLNRIAERGGWPSAGVQFTIKDKKAVDVLVGGKPLDPSANYIVANSDYIANGGDDCDMLTPIPQQNKGVLVRDAFLHYFQSITAAGKKINAQIENRVRYAQ
ncbi:5'-nucleotidase C-terminal domain-containing protein [Flavihumibacter sp. UBA7668]|uniref:5'-nucleotidase C-terminal domain-containing protein n=1 Tax=Flavihumibacter sp. UBA7668 TaxID=1946542 RepID=UPI0025C347A2|nr:5'-nucleotidase C-terminal domain-containing protein [Flavihumibacter sp. UBA7668]